MYPKRNDAHHPSPSLYVNRLRHILYITSPLVICPTAPNRRQSRGPDASSGNKRASDKGGLKTISKKKRVYRHLWKIVRQIIRANYELIATQSIRGNKGSRGIRASYYIVGDLLEDYRNDGRIDQEDYDWYITDQGYNSYRDDIWPSLEQKEGFVRPEAKAIGIVYDNGVEHPISHLAKVWDQARGFIFVEKAGDAELIQELSDYGWTIVAGQGYPTRLMRKLLKNDTRPVVALHDWDRDGMGIHRALGFKTRRTWHLNIDLGERVIDIGLNEEDVKALSLPTRPSPKKYGGVPRAEISALYSLTRRWGIENPVLAYVIASLLVRGYTLSPTEKPKQKLLAVSLMDTINRILEMVAAKTVVKVAKEQNLKGRAVKATAPGDDMTNTELYRSLPQWALDLEEAITEAAEKATEDIEWSSEDDYHKEALKLTDERIINCLKAKP